jgi:hypothetical protein
LIITPDGVRSINVLKRRNASFSEGFLGFEPLFISYFGSLRDRRIQRWHPSLSAKGI